MRKLTNNEAGAGVGSVTLGMGDSLAHESAIKHVTGGAQYVDDILEPADLLHVATGQSTIAHGRIKSLNLDSVTSISIGSAPLSETVANQALAVFSNAAITNSYGTTEAGAGMFGAHPDRLPTPRVSLGYPQSHVEVRLVDGLSEKEGVLEVRTAAAMNEYLNLPEKTSEKTTTDGWVTTGDTMRMDDNGFYFFVGRDDDMFNCSGENIYPGEIERILETDARIAESCVVPLTDDIRGQIPVAFIVSCAEISKQSVKDIVLAGAPAYMYPRHVIFLDAMPLAGTNKIDRMALEKTAARQILSPG